MSIPIKLLDRVTSVLVDRLFTERQIKNIIPRLHKEYFKEPTYLAQIIDTWNLIMNPSMTTSADATRLDYIPPIAVPPPNSVIGVTNINMNTILGDIEPDLLLFEPKRLVARNKKVNGLGCVNNMKDHWILLFNAPRGIYLQDWLELTKKVYYIERYLLDFLYDKKEQKNMETHPLIKSAAAVESDFDHIRTRYLFASRSGYKSLSHLFSIQTAQERPTLRDIILVDDRTYLEKFAPFCTPEEYSCFADLIKNHNFDEDDADVFEKLAELDKLSFKD